jgi:hypothetical protein
MAVTNRKVLFHSFAPENVISLKLREKNPTEMKRVL